MDVTQQFQLLLSNKKVHSGTLTQLAGKWIQNQNLTTSCSTASIFFKHLPLIFDCDMFENMFLGAVLLLLLWLLYGRCLPWLDLRLEN